MICPKCGQEQPEAPECAHCGVIVARALAAAQRPDRVGRSRADEPDHREQLQALVDDLQRTRKRMERQARALWQTRPPAWDARIDFYREMSRMLFAGLPHNECLDALSPLARRAGMAPVVAELTRLVEQGHNLWQAMEAMPHAFSTLETNMVELALRTNQIRPVFKRITTHLGEERDALYAVVGARPFPFAIPAALALLFSLVWPLRNLEAGVFAVVGGVFSWLIFWGLLGLGAFSAWLWLRQRDELVVEVESRLAALKPLSRWLTQRRYRNFFFAMRTALGCGMAANNAALLAARATGDPLLTRLQADLAHCFAEGGRIGDGMAMLPGMPEAEIAAINQGDKVSDVVGAVQQCADLFTQRWRRGMLRIFGGALALAALLVVLAGVRSGLAMADLVRPSTASAAVAPKGPDPDEDARRRAEMERAAEQIGRSLPALQETDKHTERLERASKGQ